MQEKDEKDTFNVISNENDWPQSALYLDAVYFNTWKTNKWFEFSLQLQLLNEKWFCYNCKHKKDT